MTLVGGRFAVAAALIAGATLVGSCSKPAPQQPAAQQPTAPALSAEERGWDTAAVVGTVAALEQYLKDFSDGAHAAEASRRIATLRQELAEIERRRVEAARRIADDKAFADTAATASVETFRQYLRDFADGAHAAEARQRLAVLEQQRAEAERQRIEQARRAADDKAFADAATAASVTAFQAYLRDFDAGAHVAEARQRLAELEQRAEQERLRADAERARIEQERRAAEQRAQAERQRVEAEQRAAAERLRAEQARHQAEQEAQAELQRVQRAADDKAFAEAATNTDALNRYIDSFSNGAHVAEVRQQLAALEQRRVEAEQQRVEAERQRVEQEQRAQEQRREAAARAEAARRATDDAAFQIAGKAGTTVGLADYLQRFPDGAHAAEAKQKLAAMAAQRSPAAHGRMLAAKPGAAGRRAARQARGRSLYVCRAVAATEPPLGHMSERGRLCVADHSCRRGFVKLVVGAKSLDVTTDRPLPGGRARQHRCVRPA